MSSSKTPPYTFDGFALDVDERTLTFRGQPISLTPKAFRTLVLLLQNHGKVVEKEDFLSEVWADTFVEESTLAQNILTLRKALGRYNAKKEFIATVPRRGYQFVADVEVPEETKSLVEQSDHDRTGTIALPTEAGSVISRPPSRSMTARWMTSRNVLSLGVLVLLAIATGYIASKGLARSGSAAAVVFQKFRVDPIVEDANIRNSVISPNGKYLAMLQVKSGSQSLYVRQIDTGNTVEIVPRIRGRFIGASFAPLSDQIYYAVSHDPLAGRPAGSTLYRISVHGGASQVVLQDIDSPAAVAPDESKIAFVRQKPQNGGSTLVIADISGGNERELTARQSESGFTSTGVSWSPDSRYISAAVTSQEAGNSSGQVCVVDAATGGQRILTNENWASAGQTVWLADGSGIVTVAYGAKSPTLNDELWIVSFPDGSARLVTNGINGAYGISLNATTGSVVAVESNKFACFLTAPVDNLFKNTHLLTTISDEVQLPFGADWTSDGKIVYSAIDAGNADIFMISEDGSQRTQLTSDPSAEISPRLSADGRFLVFLSNRTGRMEVWRSDANGTNAIQLTERGHVRDLVIAPDGETVYYLAADGDARNESLWRVSINGEHNARLTERTTRSASVSPDGKTLAAYISNPETNAMGLALLSAETGQVVKNLETPPNDDISFTAWSRDGNSLFLVLRKDKPVSLWRLPLSDGQPQQLREWENDAIFRLAISRDGRRLFYEVGNELNSVMQFQSL